MNAAEVSAGPGKPGGLRRIPPPPLLLVLLTLLGLGAFILVPQLATNLGLVDYGRWFLDSYAVLASNDAVRAGLDPLAPNPLDDLHREHVYSDWWFTLGRLGFTRADNFLVGGSWVLAFFGTVWWLLRPTDWRQAVWFALLVISPPVLLAVMRGNNDLVIFVLLAIAVLALRPAGNARFAVALAGIVLATGLKFYPAVAAGVFLLVRPVGRLRLMLPVAGLAVAAALASVWGAIGRGVMPMPSGVYTMGAPVLFRDLGFDGRSVLPVGGLLLAAGMVWLVATKRTTGLAAPGGKFQPRAAFMIGALVLLACFLAGTSFAYRWIFSVLLAPWLWEQAHAAGLPARDRRLAACAGGLLLTVVWMDGLLCLVGNQFFPTVGQAVFDHWQHIWRLGTQPLVWLLMLLLAGWLLDALLATGRELRAGWRRQ